MLNFSVIQRQVNLPVTVIEPVAVYRFLHFQTGWKNWNNDVYLDFIYVDEEIENPDTDKFLFILEEVNPGEWLCECLGELLIIRWQKAVSALFNKFTLPLIKRAYPTLLASKLVNVQPMQTPASLIFYVRYKYAKMKADNVLNEHEDQTQMSAGI